MSSPPPGGDRGWRTKSLKRDGSDHAHPVQSQRRRSTRAHATERMRDSGKRVRHLKRGKSRGNKAQGFATSLQHNDVSTGMRDGQARQETETAGLQVTLGGRPRSSSMGRMAASHAQPRSRKGRAREQGGQGTCTGRAVPRTSRQSDAQVRQVGGRSSVKLVTAQTQWRTRTHDGQKRIDMHALAYVDIHCTPRRLSLPCSKV